MSSRTILVVNPGSTSTKLGLFEDQKQISVKKVAHSAEEIAKYPKINDQVKMRRSVMDEFLSENSVVASELGAVVGRGGLLKPMRSGTYNVNQKMVDDLTSSTYGEHASNIGAMLAWTFNQDFGVPAFIVDPVVVDELQEQARFTGIKEIPRRSIWHALNIMAVVRHHCKVSNLDREKENFVVVHIGGGISVAAIKGGRCIDVSNGLEAGPFTPERAGTLPSLELVNLCFSGKYTHDEIKKLVVGRGGLVNYLGTSALPEVEKRINEGDQYAKSVLDAMSYQIAKEVGSYLVVLKGQVNSILLTGGGANNKIVTGIIKDYVETFAPVKIYPGEDELSSLALGALRVLKDETKALEYQ